MPNSTKYRMAAAIGLFAVMLASGPAMQSGKLNAHPPAHEQAVSGPERALAAYRDALQNLDMDAAAALFVEDSSVFENGKAEGSFADYSKHHLGPELHLFKSFKFSGYEVEIRSFGDLAHGIEQYSYRIELTDGRIVERDGVATSLLQRQDNASWKIVSYHSSSRKPKDK